MEVRRVALEMVISVLSLPFIHCAAEGKFLLGPDSSSVKQGQ